MNTIARHATSAALALALGTTVALSCAGCSLPSLFGGHAGPADTGVPQVPGLVSVKSTTAYDGGAGMALVEYEMTDAVAMDPFEGQIAHNTEEYAAIVEHGFTSVASKPFSTFSADVDTASYANLRRLIRDGYAREDIPAGAVRIEEMLNYFGYDYAAPEEGELFGVTASIADCPWNPQTKLLVVGLQTRDLDYAEQAERVGNNLVFLVDVSGSMDEPDKLPLLQRSFAYLLDNLSPNDTVSIVTYASGEKVIVDGAKASERQVILDALGSLEANGSTNGQAGLATAYEVARSHFVEGGNNRIVMASDGDLNVGITSESDLSEFVRSQRDSGIYLSVLGFGSGNYKDTKMETIADDGNGAYFYIDCADEARRVFGEQLCSTLVTVAQDVKLQVEFNPAYVKGYRQIGYENRALADDAFLDDTTDAGEVGAGMSVTVAYELVMADSEMELFTSESRYGSSNPGVENGEWLAVSVRYKAPGAHTDDPSEQRTYPITGDAYTTSPSADWSFAASVAEFGMIMRESENIAEGTPAQLMASLDAQDLSGDERRGEFKALVKSALAWDL